MQANRIFLGLILKASAAALTSACKLNKQINRRNKKWHIPLVISQRLSISIKLQLD
jgi:5-hydroxyisourate hydrolase-like protein (transthyretin family)